MNAITSTRHNSYPMTTNDDTYNIPGDYDDVMSVEEPSPRGQTSVSSDVSVSEDVAHTSLRPRLKSIDSNVVEEKFYDHPRQDPSDDSMLEHERENQNVLTSPNKVAPIAPLAKCDGADKTSRIPLSHLALFCSTVKTIEATLTEAHMRQGFEEEVSRLQVFDEAEYEVMPPVSNSALLSDLKNKMLSGGDSEAALSKLPPKKRMIIEEPKPSPVRSRKKNGIPDKRKGVSKQKSRSKSVGASTVLRPFKCVLCSSSFDREGHLRVHILAVHEKKRPFSCPLCEACFGHSSSLLRHMRTVHNANPDVGTGRLPSNFRGSPVSRVTVPKGTFRNGSQSRGGRQKPYRCNLCRASFGRQSMLKQHKTRKHADEDDIEDHDEDDTHGELEDGRSGDQM